MHAVRNIRLCTKDCLCLYVCPTGATDTETGQIDASKCIGCGACAGACPSHAISMVPEEYPPQQPKTAVVKKAMAKLVKSKVEQEKMALRIAGSTDDPMLRQLAEAIGLANRRMAEDLWREAGYMLPQSKNTREFLESLLQTKQAKDFPRDAVSQLLEKIKCNEPAEEKPLETWRCTVCGYLHEGPMPADFKCPRCGQPASVFEKIETKESDSPTGSGA